MKPLDVMKMRYTRGEIIREEYEIFEKIYPTNNP
jgi:uncharacterized membrane protein